MCIRDRRYVVAETWSFLIEESSFCVFNRGNDQSTIQEFVTSFARGFCDEQATVTCGAVKETLFLYAIRPMLGTDRVVGAKAPEIDGIL